VAGPYLYGITGATCWVVERSFAWAARFRRPARDYERLAAMLEAYHWLAFATLMLQVFFSKSP
jgi:transposase